MKIYKNPLFLSAYNALALRSPPAHCGALGRIQRLEVKIHLHVEERGRADGHGVVGAHAHHLAARTPSPRRESGENLRQQNVLEATKRVRVLLASVTVFLRRF